ncbi:hypothetical protein TRIUR3_01208 [Triticum urartu]|uniref:Late embryogenesis abundant protein LEA-2 subgroup domain-containing protein n=1 Tax=Triticum urartu TaxID=4572 RepID=M7Z6Y0_TRIUA|nr:hypothetical protein TRIUR3_01208 [Triticum urartu]
MAIHIPPPSKWSHKHIILVTLIGTLVAIAITAIVSISLSPAHIYLSLTDMKVGGPVEDTKFYNFTIVANNSSPRMAVLYGALDAEIWYSETAWVPAMVDLSVLQGGRRQTPGNVAHINVSAEIFENLQSKLLAFIALVAQKLLVHRVHS